MVILTETRLEAEEQPKSRSIRSKKQCLAAGWVRVDVLVRTPEHRAAIQKYAKQLSEVEEGRGVIPEIPEELLSSAKATLSAHAANILARTAEVLKTADADVLERLERRLRMLRTLLA